LYSLLHAPSELVNDIKYFFCCVFRACLVHDHNVPCHRLIMPQFFSSCLVRCHNYGVPHFLSTLSHTSLTHFVFAKLWHKCNFNFSCQTFCGSHSLRKVWLGKLRYEPNYDNCVSVCGGGGMAIVFKEVEVGTLFGY
jgi:hypothetical protein